ncbi:MAG: hypothetical protein WCP96_09520 [Methylococcaceae bacterium]
MKKLTFITAAVALVAAQQANAAQTAIHTNLGTSCGYSSSSRAADSITTSCVGMFLSDVTGGLAGTKLDINWGIDLSKTGGIFANGKLDVTLPDGRTLSCANFSGTASYPIAAQIAPAILKIIPTYLFALDGSCSGVDNTTGKNFQISTHQDGNVRYQLLRSRRVGSQIIPGGVVWSLWNTGGSITVTE